MDKKTKPKKTGRPATGRTPVTQFRLGPEVLAALEYLAGQYGMPSKAAVVRFLAIRAEKDERRKNG